MESFHENYFPDEVRTTITSPELKSCKILDQPDLIALNKTDLLDCEGRVHLHLIGGGVPVP